MVDVRAIARELAIGASDSRIADVRLEDVWIFFGDRVECRLGDAEVFCEDRLRSMGDPVIDIEGSSCLISCAT